MALCVDTSRPQPTKNRDQNNSSQSDHHHFRYLNYYQPNFSNLISCPPISHTNHNSQEFIQDLGEQQEEQDVDKNDCLRKQQSPNISCKLKSENGEKHATKIHDDGLAQQQSNISCKLEYTTKNHDDNLQQQQPNISCKLKYEEGKMYVTKNDHDGHDLWSKIVEEAKNDIAQEPILSTYYYNTILSHKCLASALANHLSEKLSFATLNSTTLFDLFLDILIKNKEIINDVNEDLRAVRERDPACISYVHCLLNFKGFLACQSHRIAHKLWTQGRKIMALMIQSRVSEVFAVDIHPGAKIGKGILLDHATGVVIGETAVIGNNVSILHNVTLGGTGKVSGDRHPKIGDGVLIGAGTCVLGNVKIGDGAKIGAGSVVLKGVPPRTTAVGNPAKLIGGVENPVRLDKIPSFTMDHTYDVTQWSDYVI